MASSKTPRLVQPFAGLIAHPREGFERATEELVRIWGGVDMESPVWPFDFTDYYADEMGEGLLRKFVAFENLTPLDGLHRMKTDSVGVEVRLAATSQAPVQRPVNIDPGYLCHAKLVLFSTKDFSHRIYIADGVYAEVTLEWRKGRFTDHPWTFPDYRTEDYKEFFTALRERYVRKLAACNA